MLEDFICFIIKLVLIGLGFWMIGSVIVVGFLFVSAIRWQVHEVTPQDRAYYAEHGTLPELADMYERYGVKGILQGTSSQRETYAYPSLDDLCNAMPEIYAATIRKALVETEPTKIKDVKGKKADAYRIDAADLQVTVPEPDSSNDYPINFYVFQYKNGDYRFVIQCP